MFFTNRNFINKVDNLSNEMPNVDKNQCLPLDDNGKNNPTSNEGELQESDSNVAWKHDSIENIQISIDVQFRSNSPRNKNNKNTDIGIAINSFKETNTSFPQVSENIEDNIKYKSEADKKSKAQILAAKRCLLTDLFLASSLYFHSLQ